MYYMFNTLIDNITNVYNIIKKTIKNRIREKVKKGKKGC